jgi:hypothetical protein
MKNENLYTEYVAYLDWRLNENQISKGKYSILKISRTSFDDFRKKIESDSEFNKKIRNLYKSDIREKKINDIIKDIDLLNVSSDNKIDDFFDDFNF